jgi:ABC-type polar amino acid transport system ATPase subunit
MVELRDVCMQFEDKKVLDGCSLKVDPEERLVVMGQSGSGKSTLLRLILGFSAPIRFDFSSNLRSRALAPQASAHSAAYRHGLSIFSAVELAWSATMSPLPLEEVTDKSRAKSIRSLMKNWTSSA